MNRDDPAPSIWLVQHLPRKIAKGSIDRQAIATAAAELLDEAGLESFTMRHLGRRLGVSAMACYAHVRHKDDVLELAQDHVMGQLTVHEGDWQVVLRALAEDYRALLVDHPWLPTLAGRFLNAGPNVAAMTRTAARRLTAAGLPDTLVPFVLSAAFTLAHGHGAVEAAWRSRMTETDLDELTTSLATRADADPVLTRRATIGADRAGQEDWDFAITSLIAGITPRLSEPTTKEDTR